MANKFFFSSSRLQSADDNHLVVLIMQTSMFGPRVFSAYGLAAWNTIV